MKTFLYFIRFLTPHMHLLGLTFLPSSATVVEQRSYENIVQFCLKDHVVANAVLSLKRILVVVYTDLSARMLVNTISALLLGHEMH